MTTTQAAYEETASRIRAAGASAMNDPAEVARKKRELSRSSIAFGNEQVMYESQSTTSAKNALRIHVPVEERMRQADDIKRIKAGLMRTNFVIGEEPTEYAPTSRLPVPTNLADARGKMSPELAHMIKASSIHFGNAHVDYSTVAKETMKWPGQLTSAERVEAKQRQADMQLRLQKHSFTFGEEHIDYTTNAQRDFKRFETSAEEERRRRDDITRLTQEIKAAHFSLGNDYTEYKSNTQMSMEAAARAQREAGSTLNLEHIRAMKQALQRTSFVIGDDPDYM